MSPVTVSTHAGTHKWAHTLGHTHAHTQAHTLGHTHGGTHTWAHTEVHIQARTHGHTEADLLPRLWAGARDRTPKHILCDVENCCKAAFPQTRPLPGSAREEGQLSGEPDSARIDTNQASL